MSLTPHGSMISKLPASLLQHLIRFDTTNPPGNEAACISYIRDLLTQVEVPTMLLARNPARLNLIARLPGQGHARPFLLQGHIDVVTTEHQVWQHPPFEGQEVDGYIWGRGALDMKGGVAMMLAASMGGRTFYPIQVVEKQLCWLKATVRGPEGHRSVPMRGGAMAKLSHLLHQLDAHRLPVHITPVARQMVETMNSALPPALGSIFSQLLDPACTDQMLDGLGPQGLLFDPLLHNTVNATIVRGGNTINVVPSAIEVELDGRLLPGSRPADLITELRAIVGDEVELDLVRHDAGPAQPDLGLFEMLADSLRELDPEGIPIPLLLAAVTDARFFSRLGIQTYGFLPMQLPEAFNFVQAIHAADEPIPVAALEFGTTAIYTVLQRFEGK